MDNLRRYLYDCESKRRRARDRPSNMVLEELRLLVSRFEEAQGHANGRPDSDRVEDSQYDSGISPVA